MKFRTKFRTKPSEMGRYQRKPSWKTWLQSVQYNKAAKHLTHSHLWSKKTASMSGTQNKLSSSCQKSNVLFLPQEMKLPFNLR